ncbi:MAG: peptidoglycan D,D-transpeptidase FtsI family protein [Lachnospiraceae bacterium]
MKQKLVILFFIVLLAFLGLSIRLIIINRDSGEQYTRQILSQQQYSSTSLPYKRGEILDTNGTKLAISQKVYNLIIDCKDVLSKEEYLDGTLDALMQCFPQFNRSEMSKYITDNPTRRYYVVAKQLTYDEISGFLEMKENSEEYPNIYGVWFEEEYKRVYPNNTLASDIIGFTIKDSESSGFTGSNGLEEYYNEILNGTVGREYGYLNDDLSLERTTIAAVDGHNLITTIDANIQSIVEKKLQEHNEKYTNNYRTGNGAENVGAIVMNIHTGEILAMASYPNFDLNSTTSMDALIGSTLLTAEGKESEEGIVITADNKEEVLADTEVLYANLNSLWKNFCITDTYEPGSTAKPFTVAMGLESGTMTGDEYYTCNGLLEIGGFKIKCHNYKIGGDGTITVKEAVEQSCNVALMLMGRQIGKDIFLEYQESFGFGIRTNIDLVGESRTQSLVFNEQTLGETELATSTFGQGYNVTMIQMIAAYSALVNGGYYYEPHLVKKITTSSGATVQNIEPRLLRQTVSEQTSEKVREYLVGVVENGTGKTARPAGYLIGGKTGTAEMAPRDKRNYVVSFIGHAPANDPQIAIYVVVDRPNAAAQDDAKHATLLVRSILTEVLPYLNIFMTEELSETELKELSDMENQLLLPSTTDDEEEIEHIDREVQDANGGDITSSTPVVGEEGETAPLTGTVINPETGDPIKDSTEEKSPY